MRGRRGTDQKTYTLKWGKETLSVSFPPAWQVAPLMPNRAFGKRSDSDLVGHALDNPIGSKRLEEIVRPGETTAILVNDMARLWNRPAGYLPALLDRLNLAGVKDRDIFIVIATGTHRANSKEEHRLLVGNEVHDRIPVFNHDCRDRENLVKVGENALGEPIRINKKVVGADRIIATGGIVLHGLAGFAGGSKSVLPGVAGYETIQNNHSRALDGHFHLRRGVGKGLLEGNPLVPEMQQAARLLGVDFMFNVVADGNGNYAGAVAGDIVEAHLAGCGPARRLFQVPFRKKAPIVVAGVGGYPRDLEMYQAVKALENATQAAREGGTIIFACHCGDGLGPTGWLSWLEMGSRETIARRLAQGFDFHGFAAIKLLGFTESYRIILVSTLPPEVAGILRMERAATVQEALEQVQEGFSGTAQVIFMPSSSATVPVLSKQGGDRAPALRGHLL